MKNRATVKLVSGHVAAGFATWAEEGEERDLDLNQFLVEHPNSTFMVRVEGESMIEAGILPGDILVVDRGLEARDGVIVIAAVAGDLTVKRYVRRAGGENGAGGGVELRAENKNFPSVFIPVGAEVEVWGVVTGVVRKI